MKRYIFAIVLSLLVLPMSAKRVSQAQVDSTGIKGPVVNGGVKIGMNSSTMHVHNVYESLYATPNVGGEIGGFLDFNVARHCVIQFNLLISGEHMDLHNGQTQDNLWVFGMDMPLYFMGRFELNQKGSYIQFGGGPYTHFVFRSILDGDSQREDVFKRIYTQDDLTGEEYKALSDNYSGVGLSLGYEWWFGLQANISYQYAITDILAYPHESAFVRPHKLSLTIGWRW